jgi:hypothetical protein
VNDIANLLDLVVVYFKALPQNVCNGTEGNYDTLSTYLSIYLSIYGFTVLFLDLDCFFSFLILFTVCRISRTGDQPVTRPLPRQTQNKSTQISMP